MTVEVTSQSQRILSSASGGLSLWKLVGLGTIFSPVAALLTLRPLCDAPVGPGRAGMLVMSVAAGAIISLLCFAALKLPEPKNQGSRSNRLPRILLLGVLGAVGLLLGALVLEFSWRFFYGVPPSLDAVLLFPALVGFWNCFVLLIFDGQRSHASIIRIQARLRSLESQLRPHFLFNTLNTVSAFIPDQPEAAQAVLLRLASLFRKTLQQPENGCIPLSEELEITREYLEIEAARFGSRLRYKLPVAGTSATIPALSLQPLVENAVRHGISRLVQGGEVQVELTELSDAIELKVSNPVDDSREISMANLVQSGHSLQIVADRLGLLYKGKASMQVEVNGDFQVRLKIPQTRVCVR